MHGSRYDAPFAPGANDCITLTGHYNTKTKSVPTFNGSRWSQFATSSRRGIIANRSHVGQGRGDDLCRQIGQCTICTVDIGEIVGGRKYTLRLVGIATTRGFFVDIAISYARRFSVTPST